MLQNWRKKYCSSVHWKRIRTLRIFSCFLRLRVVQKVLQLSVLLFFWTYLSFFFFGRVDLSFFVCLIYCCCRHMWPVSLDVIQYSQYCTINFYQSKVIYTSVGVCVLAASEIRTEYLSLNLDGMFGLRWFEARLIIWYGRRLRRVTFSEFRWYKIMLRKGYIQ